MILMVGFVAIASAVKMPPNPFLVYPANSVTELVGQIERYPEVSDRYERHFGMTRSEMVAYAQTLHLTKLRSDGMHTVYNVPRESGVLRSRVLSLKAGTKVWVDYEGKPILQWICGNPMTRGPKDVAAESEVLADATTTVTDEILNTAETIPTVSTQADAPAYVLNSQPAIPSVFEMPTVVETAGPTVAKAGGPSLSGLLLLPLAAIAALGNNHSDSVVPERTDVVPEPVTLIVLAGGVGAVAARRRKNA